METLCGKKFGKLLVEEYVGTKQYAHYVGHLYSCKCECGKTVIVQNRNLQQNHTKSCGCLRQVRGANRKDWKGCGLLTGRLWSQIKSHARKRNLIVQISIEDAWEQFEKQKGLCALTKLPIYMPKGSKKDHHHTASLDRKNSNLNYTLDNIQWVHKDINRMKSDLSQERFFELCCLVTGNSNVSKSLS